MWTNTNGSHGWHWIFLNDHQDHAADIKVYLFQLSSHLFGRTSDVIYCHEPCFSQQREITMSSRTGGPAWNCFHVVLAALDAVICPLTVSDNWLLSIIRLVDSHHGPSAMCCCRFFVSKVSVDCWFLPLYVKSGDCTVQPGQFVR